MLHVLPMLLSLGALSVASLEARSLRELAPQISSSLPYSVTTEDELEIAVAGSAFLSLPLPGAVALSFECSTDGVFLLTWMSDQAKGGPPWRYRRLDAGTTSVRLDLMETEGWSTSSHPVLRWDGSGRVKIRALRVATASTDAATAQAALDRARLWMRDSVSHSIINALLPPVLSSEGPRYLPAFLGGAGLGVFLVLFLARRLRKRPLALEVPLALSALFMVFGYDAYFLVVRFSPMVQAPLLDREQRIRRNHYFAPEVGELAALAAATLPAGARVGVLASDDDWFGPEALCFNLMPRACVRLGATSPHQGLSGIVRLETDAIDSIVAFNATTPLPPGFVRVAGINPQAFIARRP